jgi:hypothetical protein
MPYRFNIDGVFEDALERLWSSPALLALVVVIAIAVGTTAVALESRRTVRKDVRPVLTHRSEERSR